MARQDKLYCPQCKTETAVVVKPVFQGFEKVGETRSCTFCGTEVQAGAASAAPPASKGVDSLFGDYKPQRPPNPFGDEPIGLQKPSNPFGGPVELPKVANPFGEVSSGPARLCRHCRHYVVNPFVARCMHHDRDVTATDTCDDFDPKPRSS